MLQHGTAVVAHAVDEDAVAFYARFGFQAASATPRTLMVTLASLRAAGYLWRDLGWP